MKKFLIIGVAVFIAACGFKPVYQVGSTLGGDRTVLDGIAIDSIPDASGVTLRNQLIDRFYHQGMPTNPPYLLQIRLSEDMRSLAISRQNTTTRSQIIMRAHYKLVDYTTRQVVDEGEVRAVNSYNVLSSQYTTLVTQNKARELALQELADEITRRMAVVLSEKEDD